jgi:hypothetical protein
MARAEQIVHDLPALAFCGPALQRIVRRRNFKDIARDDEPSARTWWVAASLAPSLHVHPFTNWSCP